MGTRSSAGWPIRIVLPWLVREPLTEPRLEPDPTVPGEGVSVVAAPVDDIGAERPKVIS